MFEYSLTEISKQFELLWPHGSAGSIFASYCSLSKLWSALHDFAQHDRYVSAKGWDAVGPDHPFCLFQVPLRPSLAVALPP
jgi:hypothetical protein